MQFDPDEYGEGVADEIVQSTMDETASIEESSTETEEALTAAMQRIEEANLWKVLIKQNVFEEGSARPEILESANRKIKRFALNELNKLLNINQPEPVAPKVEVKMPFSENEVLALRLLATSALNKGMIPGSSAEVERTPKVAAVAVRQEAPAPTPKPTPEPAIRKVAPAAPSKPVAQQAKPTQQAKPAAAKAPRRRGGRAVGDGRGAGYALPTSKPLPMPTADQLMGMQMPTPQVTTEKISERDLNAANPQALVSAVVSQLTGGNVVSQHNTISEEDDINGRF